MGKRCAIVIYLHKGKCTTLIFILLGFGLSHWYDIHANTGWQFLIVLHFVKRFEWNRSVLTQYSYYHDFFSLWPASRLCDHAIFGYSPLPGQRVSTILWNITTTVWIKSQVHHVSYYFVLIHDIFTPKNTETHYKVSTFCTRRAVLNHWSFRVTSWLSVHFEPHYHDFKWIALHIKG